MAVNITTDTNTVKVTSTSTNTVKIVDSGNNTTVSVSQPTTRVITVATVGPQGPVGPAGFPYTGSAQITGSLGVTGSVAILNTSNDSALSIYNHDQGPWSFQMFNNAYSTSSVFEGGSFDSGEFLMGNSTNKPIEIYNNSDYEHPTLIISSSGVTVTKSAKINVDYLGTSSIALEVNNNTLLDNIPGNEYIGTGIQGTGAYGVRGITDEGVGVYGYSSGQGNGVRGYSTDGGNGVRAESPNGVGLYAIGDPAIYAAGDTVLNGNLRNIASSTNGGYTHAEGNNTQANGDYSHAEGNLAIAQGDYSHAEGNNTRAVGLYSHAEGVDTVAYGDASHAEGTVFEGDVGNLLTTAYGYGSHAEGLGTVASGSYSHAEGASSGDADYNYILTAKGVGSHAEGISTTSIGEYSHAEGNFTIAQGDYSHAEGRRAQTVGTGSHAEGQYTIAYGNFSHAEGNGTIASGSYQHVQGQYNITSSAQGAFIHGNGTADNARSNLIFASGSEVQITGSLKVSGSITGSLFGTSSFAQTASYAPSYLPLTGGTIAGNLAVAGTASIAYLNVTFESASVVYSSGSNIFGDATNDIQTLNGTVIVSGSQQITGSLTVSSSNNTQLLVGTNSLFISSSGNIGIGTTSPSTTLQVSSATNQGVAIGVASYPSWMGTNGLYVDGAFRANSYLVGSGGGINWGASQAKIIGYNPSTGADTYLSFFTGGISANGERIRIIDNGNVGIGTTTPTGKLSVLDTTLASGSANTGSLLDLQQTWNTTGTPTAIKLNVTNTNSNSNSRLIDLQIGGASQFYVTSFSVYANRFSAPEFRAATDATMLFGTANISTQTKYVDIATGTLSQPSGINSAVSISPIYNQVTSTAANTDLKVNRTETSVGSGTQLLMDLQVGGVSKFAVSSSGLTTVAGNILPDTDNTRSIGTGTQGLNLIWTRTVRSNNTLGFYPNGVLAATFATGGNLLLGTATDNGYRLQVSGSGAASGSLYTDGFVNHTGTISSSVAPANNPSASLMVIGGTTIQSASAGLNSSAVQINTIMSASANSQTLVGLDINPTFVGGVGAFNNAFVISGGTGYVAGTYASVPLTGGSGTGAQATIVVNASGAVSSVTITTAGSNYNIGDVLSASSANIGGTGSGFTYSVTLLANSVTSNALRVKGDILPQADSLYNLGSSSKRFQQISARQIASQYYYGQSGIESYFGSGGNTAINFVINNSVYGKFAATTGNFLLGTTTDSGFKLDVNGTSRHTGDTTITGSLNVTGSITSSGNIVPSANATYDLGTPLLNFTRVRAQNVVSNGSLSLYSGGSLGLTVASSANILIGTTTDDGVNRLQVSGSARITNGLTVTGSVNITGSLIMSPSSSFILPLSASATPAIGSAYWSGSLLFVYNGTRYMSASFF